jgi:hypothetical protein
MLSALLVSASEQAGADRAERGFCVHYLIQSALLAIKEGNKGYRHDEGSQKNDRWHKVDISGKLERLFSSEKK